MTSAAAGRAAGKPFPQFTSVTSENNQPASTDVPIRMHRTPAICSAGGLTLPALMLILAECTSGALPAGHQPLQRYAGRCLISSVCTAAFPCRDDEKYCFEGGTSSRPMRLERLVRGAAEERELLRDRQHQNAGGRARSFASRCLWFAVLWMSGVAGLGLTAALIKVALASVR